MVKDSKYSFKIRKYYKIVTVMNNVFFNCFWRFSLKWIHEDKISVKLEIIRKYNKLASKILHSKI